MPTEERLQALILKSRPPHSEKDVYLSLTDEGRKVFEAHGRLHSKMYAELSQLPGEFSGEDIERIALFLSRVQTYMAEYDHSVL